MDQNKAYDVALAACEGYEDPAVEAALRQAVDAIDGLSFVKPGMRIVVKVNLVTAMKPDTAATVHPSVVCALVKLLRERGAEVVLGDGPGGIYSAGYLRVVYDVCGMRRAEEFGAKLNDDFSVQEVAYPEAAKAKHFPYTAYLGKADAIIDLCKLKTHGMMGMTCAIKNFFGSIPGAKKPEFHYMFPRPEDFADVLVDLYEYSAPRLCICDAVVGMEGNGPTMGTPRPIGCLIAAKNGHMLDAVAAGLIGLSPEEIPTLSVRENALFCRRSCLPSLCTEMRNSLRFRISKPSPRSPTCFSTCWETDCPARLLILSSGGSSPRSRSWLPPCVSAAANARRPARPKRSR